MGDDAAAAALRFFDAAKKGFDEVLEEYLTGESAEFGITANHGDSLGETALHWAARAGHVSSVKLLLQHGAKVDAVDKGGETPLHKAAWRNQADVVKALIKSGASRSLKNKDGNSPLDLAKNADTRRLLVPHVEVTEDEEDYEQEDEDSA